MKATYDDVNLILKLYEMRRDEKLRAARAWYSTNFKVKTFDELNAQYAALRGTKRLANAEFRVASAGYFAGMEIPLVRGRLFQESDGADSPHVALINQTLARSTWPNEDPIGRQLQFGGMDGDLHLLHIIGVVGDVRDESLDAAPRPMVYVNYLQRPRHAARFEIVLRGHGDPASLRPCQLVHYRRASNSSSVSSISSAARFSFACSSDSVPGIGSIAGERLSSQASAIWVGVAPRR